MSTGTTEYKRGCIASSPERLIRSHWAGRKLMTAHDTNVLPAPPTNIDCTGGVRDLDIYFNDSYGCCVGSEEMEYLKFCGPATSGVEVSIPDANAMQWFRSFGCLDGANIEDAMVYRQTHGAVDAQGAAHCSGKHGSIDFTNQLEVQLALQYFRSMKIGIAAGQVQSVCNDKNGWYLGNARRDQDIDHCVGIYGCGEVGFLASLFPSNSIPSGVDPKSFGLLMYTWATLGIIDWASFKAITGEAWVRITDPSRGDAPAWDMVADTDYTQVTNDPAPPSPVPPTPPAPVGPIVVGPVAIAAGSYQLELKSGPFNNQPCGKITIPTTGQYHVTFQQ
jgi:hypothetical protein